MAVNESKKKYIQMFSVVKVVIDRWDSYGLLKGGAPEDEFRNEIALVVAKIKTIRTENDAARILSEVFSEAFEPPLFTVEACTQVGHELFHELKKANFVLG